MTGAITELKENYELYHKLKNPTRKKLLLYIYGEARTYKDLMEYSQLKPGSLYHHLGLLESLIEKVDHGLYQITQLGKSYVENLNLTEKIDRKPKIEQESKLAETIQDTTSSINQEKINLDPLELVWLSPVTYFSILLTVSVMIFLSNLGIALAGSAIYSVEIGIALIIDVISIFLGMVLMYFIEDIGFKYTKYQRIKFIGFIRILTMLPAVIVGMTLYILYWSGINPVSTNFEVLFGFTLLLGTLFAASGIYFLRGLSKSDSLLYAVCPTFVDLLIGVVILISI